MTYKWIRFYTSFADKLLEYRDNRTELIRKIYRAYGEMGMIVPTLEKDGRPDDIDPFSVFGLFNKQISEKNRKNIIRALGKEFEVDLALPESFEGIPALNNLGATFYAFKDKRGNSDIENLWVLFEKALMLADSDTKESRENFISAFDTVRNQWGIKWNITMGLYWIRPYSFINLDSRNRWFIEYDGSFEDEFLDLIKDLKYELPSGSKYLEINDLAKKAIVSEENDYGSLVDLSYKAWLVSEEVNQAKKMNEDLPIKDTKTKTLSNQLRWYLPLIRALRDLGGRARPAEAREKIIENENVSDEYLEKVRGKSKINKFQNDTAFARLDLVKAGIIDGNIKGIWTLTEYGKSVELNENLIDEISKASRKPTENTIMGDENIDLKRYWTYSPGENAIYWDEFSKKGIMAIGWGMIGDLSEYASKDEMKDAMRKAYDENSSFMNSGHATWQFVHDMKVGDVVFAKKGENEIIGKGIVTSDYIFDPSIENNFKNIREVEWTEKGSWIVKANLAQKTLTDISSFDYMVEEINSAISGVDLEETENKQLNYPDYTEEDFLNDVFMSKEDYRKLREIIKYKKNIILQGSPGVGKTFISKRLAYSMMGRKDSNRVAMVQFHQSYSYEDFIMGYRPNKNEFVLEKGSFYNFCKKAEIDSDNDYFFIIDEINRGNLSKIFGEIFMLIEDDKRASEIELLYSGERFKVPENVYIIGMMNTADRSLAMLDYALRRRFAFFDIKPGFQSDGFKAYQKSLESMPFYKLISCVKELNKEIEKDPSLGPGFTIGHSYFCKFEKESINKDSLSLIVNYELIPLIKEYWFDDQAKASYWADELIGAIS